MPVTKYENDNDFISFTSIFRMDVIVVYCLSQNVFLICKNESKYTYSCMLYCYAAML